MLDGAYDVRIVLVDCNYSAEMPNAMVELTDDIGEVLPYLNAVLKGARYSPQVPALAFVHEGHRIVVRPRQVAISRLEDEKEARRVMDWLVEMANRTWEERERIQPNHDAAREPGLLEVYRLLPGGNCRQCGEPTCLAFAAKLVRGETTTAACVPLLADQHARKRDDLAALLGLG